MENRIVKLDREVIVKFLSGIVLFNNLDRASLEDLVSSLKPIFVKGGTTLIKQGDDDTCMYILYQGRLRVYTNAEDSEEKEKILAEISPGQFVGEIALLTHLPRTTTVRTVRDSILLKWEEQAFNSFELLHPTEITQIARIALKRIAVKARPTQVGENFVSLTIVPAGNSDHRLFAKGVVEELQNIKPTFLITSEACAEYLRKNISQVEFNSDDILKITGWVHGLENEFGYVVYETDPHMSPWTQYCLRQADRILLVAESKASSSALNPIETFLFRENQGLMPFIEITFVHPKEQTVILGTDSWLNLRPPVGYHHVRLGVKQDMEKLLRFLTGCAFGVVLNGGGARGLAHVGVLMALDELKIPIDYIAGTSMGAVIGAAYAIFGSSQLSEYVHDYVSHFRKEWTLPMVALLKGKYNTDFYESLMKDRRIEDLWLHYFCVSANLTKGTLKIHDRGLISQAIRASTSIPAIYPPIYDAEGNMLVDGGILNNMPVNIMRKKISGGKILAVNCYIQSQELPARKYESQWVSGWKFLVQNMNPFVNKKKGYDSIISVLLASLNLNSNFQQASMGKEADFLLELATGKYDSTDFNRASEFIQIGYDTAIKTLPTLLRGL